MDASPLITEKLERVLACPPEECPIRQILDRLGGKWGFLVLISLSAGPQRFGRIKSGIPDISQKMLTQVLRGFERDGLLEREDQGGFPRVVSYRLTALGQGLLGPLDMMARWANDNMAEIRLNRAAYDGAAGA